MHSPSTQLASRSQSGMVSHWAKQVTARYVETHVELNNAACCAVASDRNFDMPWECHIGVGYRAHSTHRQGHHWYEAIPDVREDWLVPPMKAFDLLVREHAQLYEIIGVKRSENEGICEGRHAFSVG